MKQKRNGFTLLELLVVVIIIGVLAGLAIPQFATMARRARTREAINIISAVMTAEMAYNQENGVFTVVQANLTMTLPATPTYWNSPPTLTTTGLSGAPVTITLTPNPVTNPGGNGGPGGGIQAGTLQTDGSKTFNPVVTF